MESVLSVGDLMDFHTFAESSWVCPRRSRITLFWKFTLIVHRPMCLQYVYIIATSIFILSCSRHNSDVCFMMTDGGDVGRLHVCYCHWLYMVTLCLHHTGLNTQLTTLCMVSTCSCCVTLMFRLESSIKGNTYWVRIRLIIVGATNMLTREALFCCDGYSRCELKPRSDIGLKKTTNVDCWLEMEQTNNHNI